MMFAQMRELVIDLSAPRQPMGYEVNYAGNVTGVYITNGPNAGKVFFYGVGKPINTTMHTGTTKLPITIQGSNDLVNWTDIWTTNVLDFVYPYGKQWQFYRTKS